MPCARASSENPANINKAKMINREALVCRINDSPFDALVIARFHAAFSAHLFDRTPLRLFLARMKTEEQVTAGAYCRMLRHAASYASSMASIKFRLELN